MMFYRSSEIKRIEYDAAIVAAAPSAPAEAIDAFGETIDAMESIGALASPMRVATLIGQCAHESMEFSAKVENLNYSAERLMEVWPSRFPDIQTAELYAHNPERLANSVYGGRMGNMKPGDGWRYRGRGYIQLTGRDNYRFIGHVIGEPLESQPERAADATTAWKIAAAYLATRRRHERSLLELADELDTRSITAAINGGYHGLRDRERRTAYALAELMSIRQLDAITGRGEQGVGVIALQIAVDRLGHDPGAHDGIYGPRTASAVAAALVA